MPASTLPRAFGLLDSEKNLAVGPALVEALPEMEPAAQSAALRLLGQIGHRPSLSEVVGRFLTYDTSMQQLIIRHVNDVFSGVAGAMLSPQFEIRESAVELIARSRSGRLAYLLADSLRGKCPRTRELAAGVLRRLAGEFVDSRNDGQTPASVDAQQVDDLADALRKAVLGWELHLQPKALEAAMWLHDRVETALREKLDEPRGHTVRAVNDLLESTTDPRMAAFALRALTLAPTRATAARAISRAASADFQRAVVEESWALLDPAMARGCRRIRQSPWLHGDGTALAALDDRHIDAAVRLLMSSGGPKEARYRQLRHLMNTDRPMVRRAVLWHLVTDPREEATELLRVLSDRQVPESRHARHEVERRMRRPATPPETAATAVQAIPRPETGSEAPPDAFEVLWNEFDSLNAESAMSRMDALRRDHPRLAKDLHAKLTSPQAVDRVRALRMVHSLGATAAYEELMYKLAADADPLVRSQCVVMLADLQTTTAARILRHAVHDPNVRVQANAIEALDRMNAADRQAVTEPLLDSPNPRVRANAVKSLLRLELRRAGDVLLQMLEDPDRGQRESALWVIERLRLGSLLDLVVAMGVNDPDERIRRRARRLIEDMKKHHRSRAASSPVRSPDRMAVRR